MPFSTRVFESMLIRSGRVTPASSPAAAGVATWIAASSHSAAPPAIRFRLRDEDVRSGTMTPMLTRPGGPAAGGPARAPGRPRERAVPIARTRSWPVDKSDGVGEDPPTSAGERTWLRRHRRAWSKGAPMRKITGVVPAALALGLLAPHAVFRAGYSIYAQGGKAMANAGAFTARADDPSALFFNPAGIVQLDGIRVNVGTNVIFLTGSRFESTSGPSSGQSFDQLDNTAWPSSVYYTQKLDERWAWGFGFTSPFGLKTQWDNAFPGRYVSREANLAVVNLNPNLACKIGKAWSVAVGLDLARADIRELSRNIDFSGIGAPDGFTKLTGDGNDVGWNIAGRWANHKGWSWGGSFRSRMKPEIKGDIRFENIPGPVAAAFPDGGATADIPLPATLATGVGYA